jgi:integrase
LTGAFRLTTATAKTKRPGRYCDGRGLWLDVPSPDAGNWIFRYQWEGRPKEMGLGSRHSVSLGKARDKAQAARELRATGIDPGEARRAAKARGECPTFGEVAIELIEAKRPEWRNAGHAQQWNAIQAQCASVWPKPVNSIGVIEVLDVLKPIWVSTPETGSRVRGRIESILDFARAKNWRCGENPATWRGHLEHLLPRRQKVEQSHFAAMPYQDIPAFVERLRKQAVSANLALEFLVLTAARSAEVRCVVWSEIDLDRAIWTLPPQRMKAGLAHTVPLSPRATQILRGIETERGGSGFIFPGRSASQPVTSEALRKLLPPGVTLHGFRSAFRDFAAEQTSFPREICEEALAHTTGSVERAYRRSDLLERRRELMTLWAQFCEPSALIEITSIAKARA